MVAVRPNGWAVFSEGSAGADRVDWAAEVRCMLEIDSHYDAGLRKKNCPGRNVGEM